MQKSSVTLYEDQIKYEKDAVTWPSHDLWTVKLDSKYDFLHFHDALEFGINISGKGVWHVNDRTINFDGPTYSLIGPGVWHSAHATSALGSTWFFIYINYQRLLPDSLELFPLIKNKYFINNKGDDPIVFELINSFIRLAAEKDNEKVLSNLLKTILLIMFKDSEQKEDDKKNLTYILPAINYINANFMEEINLDHLAHLCYCSKSSLRRYFLDATGLSPYKFIENVRLVNAKDMLISQKKILDIATDCGYQSITSFNRQFKKETGYTPREYRSKHN